MDSLRAAYRDDEDGDTSEASTPPLQTPAVLDGGSADIPTASTVFISASKPELLENNQSSVIKEGLPTASVGDVSSGEISLFGTPQAMETDLIDQRDTLNFPNPPLETAGEEAEGTEEERPPPKKQKQHSDLPEPKPSEPEITEIPLPADAIPLAPQIDCPPAAKTAAVDVSSGEISLSGTPQAMETDQISQLATLIYSSNPPLETYGNVEKGDEEEGPPPTKQNQLSDLPGPKHSVSEITEIPPPADAIAPPPQNESLPAAKMAAVGDVSPSEISSSGTPQAMETDQIDTLNSPNPPLETAVDEEEGAEEEEGPPPKKQKQLSDLPDPKPSEPESTEMPPPAAKTAKKSKKKNKDVWSTTSRKGKKKTKHASNGNHNTKGANNVDASIEDKVLIAPIPRFPDKNDDSPDLKICLSKVYKAEKVELSEDRLSASSTKGYRMVRATRGVTEGAWYFEIKVVHLGETGHTRLGWSTEKGDLQAPVGYDGNSYGYRDIDGIKVHKASREKYGDAGYKEGDVIGFYISLPDGGSYAPSPQRLVWHKGQRYVCAPDAKEEAKVVPGSEISYFKNGICQGVAYTDLFGGCYYPAASMYTLPNEPACVVKFNFGPDFERFPEDFGERPVPRPMVEVPYQSYDGRVETGSAWNITRMPPMLKVIKEENSKIMKASEMVG